jgi:hypothetical protein
MAWYAALAGPAQPSAWMPDRFAYQFAAASPLTAGEAVLTASEYDQGRLDWHAFDLQLAGDHRRASNVPHEDRQLRAPRQHRTPQ